MIDTNGKMSAGVRISWTVIFSALLVMIGSVIGYNLSETRAVSDKLSAKCDILQNTKLDSVIYWDEHRRLQDYIAKELTDIKSGQRELQKMLVDALKEKQWRGGDEH